MRYFLLGFILVVATVVGVFGTRGKISRKPPIEVIPDMDRQPKIRPQTPSAFFADGRASRLPVEGTVPRGAHFLDIPLNTGVETGTATNYVAVSPVPVNEQLMARGEQRYNIYCTPCHGLQGDGNGVVKNFGLATTRSLHEPRIVQMGDGEIFHVITHGRNTMGAYASQIDVSDRWAIVAYVRALQLAQLGEAAELTPDQRTALSNTAN
jgi:mono/diheme cytochrome c family protein